MGKILFVNLPFSGHVNPTLGLAKWFVKNGFSVGYILSEPWRSKIEETGAEFIPYADYPEKVMAVEMESFICYKAAYNTALQYNGEYSLLIYENWFFLGERLAEEMDIPCVKLFSNPAFNETYIKNEILMKSSLLFHMRYKPIRKIISRLSAGGIKYKYEDMLMEMAKTPAEINIVYTIREFQPYENEFDNRFLFVGPSMRGIDNDVEFEIPDSESKIIYLSFGTIINNYKFISKCIRAFEATDYSVLISIGKGIDCKKFRNVNSNIHIYNYVPQCFVLSKADLFITHGGQNSINEAMYYGVPMLVLPQGFDCESNGDQIERLQIGKKIRQGISEDDLLKQTKMLLEDENTQDNCRKISKIMNSINADQMAGEKIQQYIEKHNL